MKTRKEASDQRLRVAGIKLGINDKLGNHWSYDAEGRPLAMDSSAYIYDGDGNRAGGPSSRSFIAQILS